MPTCIDALAVRQGVEEAGAPFHLAQVPDFHCLVYRSRGEDPVTAGIQGQVGHFLFVHFQIPNLQRKVWFSLVTEWGCRGKQADMGSGEGTHLFAVHGQQAHLPPVVSRDHHTTLGGNVQAAEPDAGGRDYAVREPGNLGEQQPTPHCHSPRT